MTVSELMERLEEFDPNAEVRLMTQRHYPIESHLLGVCDNEESLERESGVDHNASDVIVYIVEGESVGYGSKAAWNEAS